MPLLVWLACILGCAHTLSWTKVLGRQFNHPIIFESMFDLVVYTSPLLAHFAQLVRDHHGTSLYGNVKKLKSSAVTTFQQMNFILIKSTTNTPTSGIQAKIVKYTAQCSSLRILVPQLVFNTLVDGLLGPNNNRGSTGSSRSLNIQD